MMNHKRALFPGSFDPFTKGHEALVRKARELFDEVVIGVGVNSTKQYYFDLEKRIQHIESLFVDDSGVRVVSFQGLTVSFCKEIEAGFLLRGLRDSKDFEFEKSIAHMNHSISGIETIFLLTDLEFSAVSSTIIREIHKSGGQIDTFVTNSHLLV